MLLRFLPWVYPNRTERWASRAPRPRNLALILLVFSRNLLYAGSPRRIRWITLLPEARASERLNLRA
jgi:hypothetical protein